MNFLHVLFSFKGRIGRQQYWLGCIVVGVLSGVVVQLSFASLGVPMPGGKPAEPNLGLSLALLPLSLALMWMSFAVPVKRFHDRGRSGLWCLLPFAPVVMIIDAVAHGIATGADIVQIALAIQPWIIAYLVIGVGFFIDLGCLPGTDGPNKYDGGPEAPRRKPNAPTTAPSAAPSLGAAELAMERAIAQQATMQMSSEPRPASAGSFGRRAR